MLVNNSLFFGRQMARCLRRLSVESRLLYSTMEIQRLFHTGLCIICLFICCAGSGHGSPRLPQRNLSWSSSVPTTAITISHERSSSTDLWRHQTGSRESSVAPAPLAARRGENIFQCDVAEFSMCSWNGPRTTCLLIYAL